MDSLGTWTLVVAVWCGVVEVSATQPPTLADIRAVVEDRNAAIDSFSVNFRIDRTHPSSLPQTPDGVVGPSVGEIAVGTLVADRSGRMLYSHSLTTTEKPLPEDPVAGAPETPDQPDPRRTKEYLVVYDGSATLTASGRNGSLSGATRRTGYDPGGALLTPRMLMGEADYIPLPQFLAETELLEPVRKQIDGNDIVELVTPPVDNDGDRQGRARVQLSLDHGFALANTAIQRREEPDAEWFDENVQQFGGFRTEASGLAFPTTFRRDMRVRMANGRVLEIARLKGELSDWRVNLALRPDTFQVDLPQGTFVDDQVDGRKFIAARVGNQDVSESVAQAQTLRDEVLAAGDPEDVNRRMGLGPSRNFWLPASVVLAVLASAAGWFLLRRRTA